MNGEVRSVNKNFNKLFGKALILSLVFIFVFPIVSFANTAKDSNEVHELIIMTTTDIHSYIMPFDYMTDRAVDTYGLTKTATLIDQIRAKHANTLLFDNGDVIQGSLLGELEAIIEPIGTGETQAVIKAMNALGYDGATVGNHEFNFGLDFLDNAIESSDFPWINANVFKAGTNLTEPYFKPYTILDHEVDGKPIKVGIIGFVPPQIMNWDKLHLDGKVEVMEIVDAAKRYIPEMKEHGADLVIALAHTGIDLGGRERENAALALAKVPGIDALVMGHAHSQFPGNANYAAQPGVDGEKGTIHGVPAVMAGSWGSHLGTIKLELEEVNGTWSVKDSESKIIGVTGVEQKQSLVSLVADVHQRTINFANTVVAKVSGSLNDFFARVFDNEVTQLVNDAQMWFIQNHFKGTEYDGRPLLSAAAPFRSGHRGGYTDVLAGDVRIKDLADIYVYTNTIQVVDIDGAALKKWLEHSAANFNHIDPTLATDQWLLNTTTFSAFNYDIIDGVEYQIDVTKPIGERIVNLTYNGEPVTSEMTFLVATNNYRAGGGGDHLVNATLVPSVTDLLKQNRDVVRDYMIHVKDYQPYAAFNWSILPVETVGRVLFTSSAKGVDHLTTLANNNVLGASLVSLTEVPTDNPSLLTFAYNMGYTLPVNEPGDDDTTEPGSGDGDTTVPGPGDRDGNTTVPGSDDDGTSEPGSGSDDSKEESTPVVGDKPKKDEKKAVKNEKKAEKGKKLPNTATSVYNMLAIGLALLLVGTGAFFYQRKRKLV